MIPRLFVAPFQDAELIELTSEDAHYLTRVLRRKAGDAVVLLNNSGDQFRGTLVDARHVRLQSRQQVSAEPAQRVILLVGLIKGERMDWLVEKATELGVAEIRPLLTSRTVPKGGRIDRWQRIAKEAAEQCERGKIPVIGEPQPLKTALNGLPATRLALLERHEAKPLGAVFGDAAVAVGPEGGWSKEESQWLLAQGFEAASLGARILRAETAALAALARMVQA